MHMCIYLTHTYTGFFHTVPNARWKEAMTTQLLMRANPRVKTLGTYGEPHSLAHRQWEDISNSRSRVAHLTGTCLLMKDVFESPSLVLLGVCQGVQWILAASALEPVTGMCMRVQYSVSSGSSCLTWLIYLGEPGCSFNSCGWHVEYWVKQIYFV